MFSKNGVGNDPSAKSKRSQSGLSFIGPEVVMVGNVTTSAQIQVDGRIDGDVRCETLSQGETGVIAGDIHAEQARIAGLVQGTVNARIVTIEANGRITGDVAYEVISIAAGAQVDGRLARRASLTGPVDSTMLVVTPIDTEASASDTGGALFGRAASTAGVKA